jgi:hypothetical protein
MQPTNLPAADPTLPAPPLALIFSARLLLAEKSAAEDRELTSEIWTENFNLRATLVTPLLKEMQGYRHGGLND